MEDLKEDNLNENKYFFGGSFDIDDGGTTDAKSYGEAREDFGYREAEVLSNEKISPKKVCNPIWLSVSEAAKIGGVTSKTVRRAIQSEKVHYKVVKDRYQITMRSVIIYLQSNTKLRNKLVEHGIGQYVKEWNEEDN